MKLQTAEKVLKILLGCIIAVGALVLAVNQISVIALALVIGLMAAIFVVFLLFIRCPHCGELLGRDRGEFCPHCGKKLREEEA